MHVYYAYEANEKSMAANQLGNFYIILMFWPDRPDQDCL